MFYHPFKILPKLHTHPASVQLSLWSNVPHISYTLLFLKIVLLIYCSLNNTFSVFEQSSYSDLYPTVSWERSGLVFSAYSLAGGHWRHFWLKPLWLPLIALQSVSRCHSPYCRLVWSYVATYCLHQVTERRQWKENNKKKGVSRGCSWGFLGHFGQLFSWSCTSWDLL